MLGEKTEFSLDRFQLDWHCPEAIGIVFVNVNEVKEFYSYLNNIGFNMEFLPPQEEVIIVLERAVNNVTLWKNIEKERHILGADILKTNSDYYYSDIIFEKAITINTDDLIDFLKG